MCLFVRVCFIAALALGGDAYVVLAQTGDSAVVVGAFRNAVAFSVDPAGMMYVIDGATSEVLKLSPEGRMLAKMGGYGWEQGTFDRPADIVSPNGLDIYVADYGNHRIERFDRSLNFISSYSTRQDQEQQNRFGYPQSVAVSRFGAIFIVDGENNRIVKLSPDGSVERVFGDIRSGAGKLSSPRRIRVSDDDLVYVLDGNAIVVFDIFGNYIKQAGSGLPAGVSALAVERKTVCVLDSCKMYTLGKSSSIRRATELEVLRGRIGLCDVIDIQALGGTMYFLTRHEILRSPILREDTR